MPQQSTKSSACCAEVMRGGITVDRPLPHEATRWSRKKLILEYRSRAEAYRNQLMPVRTAMYVIVLYVVHTTVPRNLAWTPETEAMRTRIYTESGLLRIRVRK